MTPARHAARHRLLHRKFDELIADWLRHDKNRSLGAPIRELMEWSSKQLDPATMEHDEADDKT